MQTLFLVIHVVAALAIVGLVLVQHGKGADMGAAFGSGSAGSLFGSAGASNFLSKSTAIAATLFFVTSLVLTWFGNTRNSGSVLNKAPEAQKADVKPDSKAPVPPTAGETKPAEAPKSSDIPK
jgi:preprotein translocase subunit SecG